MKTSITHNRYLIFLIFENNDSIFARFAAGIIKHCTHTHSYPPPPPPPHPTHTHPHPPTPTQPRYFLTHTHPPKIMPHPPQPTQNNAPYSPAQPHLPKIMSHPPKRVTLTQNNASITDTYTKYGPLTYIYSNFSFTMR